MSDSDASKPNKQVQAKNGVKYLQNESLFCLSESSYNEQTELLADGIMQYANRCFSSNGGKQKVKLIDFSWSGKCVVQRFSDNKKLWIDCESVN
jgi:hypothetical protein